MEFGFRYVNSKFLEIQITEGSTQIKTNLLNRDDLKQMLPEVEDLLEAMKNVIEE